MATLTKAGAFAPSGPGEEIFPGRAGEDQRPHRNEAADWHGPGAAEQVRRGFSWHTLVWALVFPPKRHRIALTLPGLFLMVLAIGIGSAAYNTASNILFITLSLLLACLLLSGLLSWFNFMGVCWRLRPAGAWRAGHETLVTVEAQNRKKWLPTYSLWFELSTRPRHLPAGENPDLKMKMREILAAAEKQVTRGRIHLRERIEAGGDTTVDWVVRPDRRGEAVVALLAAGSLFPFGFLRKSIGTGRQLPVLVWPAQVEYRWSGATAAPAGGLSGRRTVRAGSGNDLLALRQYAPGDSHRLIHWKASARLGKLMLRQFAAESHDGYLLRLDTPAAVWSRPEQFELLCSFAGTLAEDLFAAGRLRGIYVNGGPLLETRRVRDLEALFDALAGLQPVPDRGGSPDRPAGGGGPPPRPDQSASRNLMTFAPDGARGVAAFVDGRQTASA